MDKNEKLILGITMLAHGLVHGYMLTIPLLVPLWMQEWAITEATIGLIVTAGYACFGLGSLPAGVVVDKIGSFKVMKLCMLSTGISLFLGGFAQGIYTLSLVLVLLGLSVSLYHSSGMTLVSKKISARGKALGLHGVGGNLGVVALPALASVLLLFMEWRALLIIYAVPSLAVVILLYIIDTQAIEGTLTKDEVGATESINYKDMWNKKFILLLLIYLFGGLYYRGSLTFLPSFFQRLNFPSLTLFGRSLAAPSYLYSGVLIFGLLGQIISGILNDYYSSSRLLIILSLATAISLLLMPLLGIGLQVILIMLFGFLLFFLQPVKNVMLAENTEAERRGLAYGIAFLVNFGVGALGATVAGFVIQNYSYNFFFISLAIFAGLNFLVAISLEKEILNSE
ncbi:MFS transporter [Fuchsiella alkaliacetigena]|uniref:MFS transporter n=1 Tax=Fuchsiella alkaliacetigena TaxID=957042 RepID=UPI00200ACB14|nr:MFS transporter [Fuchsiella alkaliacetigena]MCK8826111.1 MFS transporter [Fuchsiella alkaliacetigena]